MFGRNAAIQRPGGSELQRHAGAAVAGLPSGPTATARGRGGRGESASRYGVSNRVLENRELRALGT
jgi:hypothetical protein